MVRKKLVVLSGAGISVESGVAPFRGTGGLWNNEELAKLATPEAWRDRTSEVLEFYNQRRAYLGEVEPNEAHRLLAAMEREFDVVVLTQNVDDLHERASSTRVVHLHGELTKVRPEDSCNREDGFSEDEVTDIGYRELRLGETGGKNNARLRPHIVFFGEPVPKISVAEREIAEADILLIVGTSLQVWPAAGLCRFAPPECEIYVIDPARPETNASRPVHYIEETATSGMKTFARAVGFSSAAD